MYSKIIKLDNNSDGKVDKITINAKLPCKANLIKNLKLTYFIDYEISFNKNYPFSFSSINYIDVDTPYGVSYLSTFGSINFYQKSPVSSSTFTTFEYSNTNLITNSTSPIDTNNLKQQYALTNFTTKYEYTPTIKPNLSSRELEINMEINVKSNEKILFKAPYLYSFKNAWIQFFSVFIPVSCFFYMIMFFAFKMGVLEATRIKSEK